MRMFFQTEPGVGDFKELLRGVRVRSTPHYFEIELAGVSPTGVSYYEFVYVAPRDDVSWWVLACIMDAYDVLMTEFLKANASVRYGITKGLEDSWPLAYEGLTNGSNGRFDPAAILRMEDPDVVAPRWFVAGVRGNLANPGLEILLDERIVQLIGDVTAIAKALTFERDKIIKKIGVRAFGHSVTQDTKNQAKWLLDNFSAIAQLVVY